MKITQYIFTAVFLLVSVTTAYAGFLPGRTIDSIQMASNGNTIYVFFDANINYASCMDADRISIPSQDARFEEIYASLLRAQAAQTEVQVLDFNSNATSNPVCNGAGNTVQSPLLRFLSQ